MSSYRVTIDIADVSDADLLEMAEHDGGNPFVRTPAEALAWVISSMLDRTKLEVMDLDVEALDPRIEGHETSANPEGDTLEPFLEEVGSRDEVYAKARERVAHWSTQTTARAAHMQKDGGRGENAAEMHHVRPGVSTVISQDFKGSGIRLDSVTLPTHGLVSFRRDGAIVYTPLHGFIGSDRFSYSIQDETGKSITKTIVVKATE